MIVTQVLALVLVLVVVVVVVVVVLVVLVVVTAALVVVLLPALNPPNVKCSGLFAQHTCLGSFQIPTVHARRCGAS